MDRPKLELVLLSNQLLEQPHSVASACSIPEVLSNRASFVFGKGDWVIDAAVALIFDLQAKAFSVRRLQAALMAGSSTSFDALNVLDVPSNCKQRHCQQACLLFLGEKDLAALVALTTSTATLSHVPHVQTRPPKAISHYFCICCTG